MTNKEILAVAMRQSAIDINCAWSNIPSARNAVRSGFVPSWVELTVKPAELADDMNR